MKKHQKNGDKTKSIYETIDAPRKKKTAITKTHLYNFDPLKPYFYTVQLGFTGVNIIFLISAQNIDCGYSLEPRRQNINCGYSLEPPRQAVLTSTHNLCFELKYEKYQSFI